MTHPTNSPPLICADFDCWLTTSWKTERRYYQVTISQDLFGAWVLKRSWGGLGSQRGSSKSHVFNNYEEALNFFGAIANRREKRGYVKQ